MASVGDLGSKITPVMVKDTVFDFKKRVFGVPILRHGVWSNASKFRTGELRIGVQAVMQVGAESAELSRKNSKEALGIDVVSEEELRKKGFLGLRKTKLVCTIGPACCSLDDLEKLAMGGMAVARLNMCHNTREWHQDVIRKIKTLNEEMGYCVSLMIDTEGSQIHVVDHGAPSSVKAEVIFTCFFFFQNDVDLG